MLQPHLPVLLAPVERGAVHPAQVDTVQIVQVSDKKIDRYVLFQTMP